MTKKPKLTNLLSNGWQILVLGALATLSLSLYLHQYEEKQFLIRLEYEVAQIERRVQFRLSHYENALVQTRAFFLSSDEVSEIEFRDYFDETHFIHRFPGIQGMGLALKIPTNKGEEMVIAYLEPSDKENKKFIGLDMLQNKNLKEAMEESQKSGHSILSKKINDPDGIKLLILYVPYFKKNSPINSPEERRENLLGFIFGSFKVENLFDQILQSVTSDLEIKIFEGTDTSQSLLYHHNASSEFSSSGNKQVLTKQMTFFDRDFTLSFAPTPSFRKETRAYSSWISALVGTLFTLLFFRIYRISRKQITISRASEETLSTAIKMRDEFFSIASHELKTPLTSLKLHTQMVKKTIQQHDPVAYAPERINALIEQTERQTQRLERLIDDMLDISRIKTSRLTIEKKDINLADLVNDVVTRMKEQFKLIPGGAPEITISSHDTSGFWDPVRIEQVINNLLTNALKYGEDKKVEIEISSTPEIVSLRVIDHGRGIPPGFENKIFDRFERAGISAHEISGLGLGLYIAKQIVNSHDGELRVESTPGKETVFIMALPRRGQSLSPSFNL